jgi:hypothetical protein
VGYLSLFAVEHDLIRYFWTAFPFVGASLF